ncbi:hypothetical protein [Paenarthrobacter sp. C1]|uniref:hypothetical protein n=1 Tax=Paenarthrobacter sp. C1 TaxID=3400220 RepID=UPI003BF5ED41
MTSLHIGRSWPGHGTPMEDNCPCPKTACGLVDADNVHPECDQHPFGRAKTLRSMHPADECPELSDVAWAELKLRRLDPVIAYMEATSEDAWQVDTVRSADGSTNCFFGHLFNMGGTDVRGNALWEGFESAWATTYRLYPINDGEHPGYPQPTPKQRVLAFLRDLNSGAVLTTPQQMEEEYAYHLAQEKVLGARTV